MKTTKPSISLYTLHRCCNQLTEHTESGYIDGCVVTPGGIVSVLIQGNCNDIHLTRFDLVKDGKHIMVSYPRRMSPLAAVRTAHRLAINTLAWVWKQRPIEYRRA
jgi:hypothetical protein